ncbi:MAG TPA: antitoxin [Solirubrobacteraceae bacterium]|nr:antitoxin [Solirubrobacteraceae bacterium]
MGFGDKLKGLRDQAQQAVVENKDKIQGAVQSAGQVANTKTKGKYADKIAKVGDKVSGSVEKIAGADEATANTVDDSTAQTVDHTTAQTVDDTDSSAAPVTQEPENPVTPPAADEAAAGFPEFE